MSNANIAQNNSPYYVMEDVLDRLRLLKYQTNFCKPMNLKPLTPYYFTQQNSNPNEQFYYFTSLFTWLMKSMNVNFERPGQFDDPNAVSTNILNAIKEKNIPFDYGPNKIKQGYGDAIIYILVTLADKALESKKFVYQKPVHLSNDNPEEAEVDEDAEVTTDSIEEVISDDIENEDDMFIDNLTSFNNQSQVQEDESTIPIVSTKPAVDPTQWKLEVERAAPLLKIHITNDNKDWRVHLDQINIHNNKITSSLVDTKSKLERLHKEIEKTLEKISSRETYINTQFESQIEENREIQDQLSILKQKYMNSSANVNDLTNQLSQISEDLDNVKLMIDEFGNGMTDSKPLAEIKQSNVRLKNEIKQMNLRIGVIEHTLLSAKMKTKALSDFNAYGNNESLKSQMTYDII